MAHWYLPPNSYPGTWRGKVEALSFSERLWWLMLMQHYGASTRLLDWTRSPFVALYFAVEANHDSDGEVWACSRTQLESYAAQRLIQSEDPNNPSGPLTVYLESNEGARPERLQSTEEWDRFMQHLGQTSPSDLLGLLTLMKSRHVDAFTRSIEHHIDDPSWCRIVFPFDMPIVTDRVNAQQGCFTVALDPRTDHRNQELIDRGVLKRYIIPVAAKSQFLRMLHASNVAGHSLFPGIDGLGRSVRERFILGMSSNQPDAT